MTTPRPPLDELEELQQFAAKGPLVHHAHSVATGAFIEQLRAHFPALAALIRQQQAVLVALLKEHDDTYDGGPMSSGMVTVIELARKATGGSR